MAETTITMTTTMMSTAKMTASMNSDMLHVSAQCMEIKFTIHCHTFCMIIIEGVYGVVKYPQCIIRFKYPPKEGHTDFMHVT